MDLNNVEFNNSEPIYMQIVDLIRKKIATGEVCEHEKLPSIREMSTTLKVNPNTMQRAYTKLEELGVTYTKRGMGSFINEIKNEEDLQLEMAKEIAKKFLTEMNEIGLSKEKAVEILSLV